MLLAKVNSCECNRFCSLFFFLTFLTSAKRVKAPALCNDMRSVSHQAAQPVSYSVTSTDLHVPGQPCLLSGSWTQLEGAADKQITRKLSGWERRAFPLSNRAEGCWDNQLHTREANTTQHTHTYRLRKGTLMTHHWSGKLAKWLHRNRVTQTFYTFSQFMCCSFVVSSVNLQESTF